MTVLGVSTTFEEYAGLMLLTIIAFGVLLFHAYRRQARWARLVCGVGAIIFGLLSLLMVGLFVLLHFII
jgi:type II secretory pathway component PulF